MYGRYKYITGKFRKFRDVNGLGNEIEWQSGNVKGKGKMSLKVEIFHEAGERRIRNEKLKF